MRGNPIVALRSSGLPGSIPACAGEPRPWRRCHHPNRVYPRVCGGTPSEIPLEMEAAGLSPRVRGNQIQGAGAGGSRRSIPACAGEPGYGRAGRYDGRVYPRVCGGTHGSRRACTAIQGLSPRVRGNHAVAACQLFVAGSIPACAGEPLAGGASPASVRVYPRVCGGTRGVRRCTISAPGLSPRVRGNPGLVCRECRAARSIPACAGEPRRVQCRRLFPRVYPRVCGGTRI